MSGSTKRGISLGIDLGTTTSCMAKALKDGTVEIIDNRDGDRLTASVVCYDPEGGAPIVGVNAMVRAMSCPENFVYEAKRMIGKGFNHKDVGKAIKNWSFKVKEIKTSGAGNDTIDNIGIVVKEGGKERVYEPLQVSATVLNYLMESARERLGEYPTNVVVTVPAYFGNNARNRTEDAAAIAFAGKKDSQGNPIKINTVLTAEPIAAAIAYGSIMLKKDGVSNGHEERILVFDLGGGTFDVTVVEFTYDKQNPVGMVKGVDGDSFLGGADFDAVIMDMALEKAKAMKLPNLNDLPENEQKKNRLRLRQEAIKVKTALSNTERVTFNVNCYCGSQDLTFNLSRAAFESASEKILDKLLERCKGVLLGYRNIDPTYDEDSGKLNFEKTSREKGKSVSELRNIIESTKNDIDRVIMVGGSSRIPIVRKKLEAFFNVPGANPKVVSPLNPDEAVAYGAAYYANSINKMASGEEEAEPSLLLVDGVPFNLNIETLGGVATPVIKARTPVPCSNSETFSTAADNQTRVTIVITEGNRARSADNHKLGEFELDGIQKAPRGVPQIEVTFRVNENNVLDVTACDKATGCNKKLEIQNLSSRLTQEDIARMTETANMHAEADKLFRERTEVSNQFENLIYAAKGQMTQAGVSDEVKKTVEGLCTSKLEWLRTVGENATPDQIKGEMKKFEEEIAGALKGGAAGEAPQGAGAAGADNDVEEIKDN